jgi:REP element-mobilizing transposase RayT
MDHYRRWHNSSVVGDTAFVTTTALNFVRIFAEPRLRDLMAGLLTADCERYAARLYSFVVMPHHVHFLVGCPRDRDISWLVQRIKSSSAKLLLPSLPARRRAELGEQSGLNGRSFWQKSFRSVSVRTEAVFWQKVEYIHNNPVRAGYVGTAEEFRWSSACDWLMGNWSEEHGIAAAQVLSRLQLRPDELRLSSS